jgi:hypothetical protein
VVDGSGRILQRKTKGDIAMFNSKLKDYMYVLFGSHNEPKSESDVGRISTLTCDGMGLHDSVSFKYRSGDGIIPSLIMRIDELSSECRGLAIKVECLEEQLEKKSKK